MTKFVKGGVPSRYITGDDVIITKGINHPGKTVDEAFEEVDSTLDEHQKDIDKLKSNLKYVYSYGGVGGRGSGGSGGGSSANPVLFVSLGGHQLQNEGNVIVLNGPGTYPLEISISNSGGETFYVTVGYGNTIDYPTEYKLSTELNKCRRSDTVSLQSNGKIVVNFYDSEYLPLGTINQNYIVNPHIFEMKFKYEFDNGSGTKQEGEFDSNNEYFIGDTVYTNPFIDASFKIDLPNVTNVSITYSIGDTDGQGIEEFTTTDITNNHFKIYLDDLTRNGIQFTDEENTGTYDVTMTLKYYVNADLVSDTLTFKITLIPNYLYIYVRNPQDLMFDTLEDLIDAINDAPNGIPEKSLPLGTYTSFYCKVYEGPIRSTRLPYTIYLKSYDTIDDSSNDYEFDEDNPSNDESRTGVYEQVEMTPPFSITFGTPGIKKLVFSTLGKKDDIPDGEGKFEKYIFVKESEESIQWHPDNIEQNDFYFKANLGDKSYSDNFPHFESNAPFEIHEVDAHVELKNSAWNPSAGYDTTILSLGLQYSMVNKDGAEILRTYQGSSQNPDIVLYSDKLFSDIGKKICIPTESNFNKSINEQYHLIQIVRYRIGMNNMNKPQYATYLYIDGKLESNDPTIRDNQLFIGRLVFNNVNAVYNLINIQYVNVTQPDIPGKYTIDGLIYQYYLAYKSIMHVGIVSDAERAILANIGDMRFDGTNTIVSHSFVQTIAPHMPIPTMMMEYSGTDYSDFITNLFKGYPNGDDSFNQRPISLYWCEGEKPGIKTNLEQITIPKISDEGVSYNGTWMVELQGTSTMRNRIKNFSLVLNTQNTTGDKVLLMSPNYKANDPTTFLPERVWTLKADIADSAHANNTAVGKFVNRTCTAFSLNNGVNLDANLKAYVKNTLEGFPVLMYFKIGEEVYYLGIYNFNMGRQSYYNLGYHTAADMVDMMGSITTSGPFTYSVGSGEVISTLAIGEIQDNFAQFDFHQYQESVLFTGNNNDGRSTMFGADSKITGAQIGAAKQTLSNFVKSVTRAGAYCFANIGKQPVPSSEDVDDNGNRYGNCINRYNVDENGVEYVPDPSWQFRYNGTTKVWEQKTDAEGGITFDGVKNSEDNLLQCISPTDSYNIPHPYYLDFSSASEYYTICMAFGLVDSILKNMNIKSWDGTKCFIAFYDMDCALGENNAGGEDVSYLAATDYWYSNTDKGYVEQVTINYDYWNDKVGKGFDFSSSYLFAIAKYAQAVLGSSYTLNNYPQQFWAKLRQPINEEDPTKTGQLCNADYFIENYFSSGIGKVPAYLASLNYQVKYLYKGSILDANGNPTEERFLANGDAFNGTRLEKVRDWLNKRLHFLDVMFNVQGIGIAIGGGYKTPVAESGLLNDLTKNPDVVILTDVFSTSEKKSVIMGSNGIPVDIYAPMNTPFIINRGGSNEIYLLCAGTDKRNPVRITATRSESYRFLGSKEFTRLSIIEPFLTSAQQIVSNNLEEITYGSLTVPPTDVDFNITSTSVKNIQFNIPDFSGSLNIENQGLYGQAVHTLNISTSGLQGTFENLTSLKSLNISSVSNVNGKISVSGCPLVGELCSISGDSNKPTTLDTLQLLGVSGKFTISDTNIQTIEMEVGQKEIGEFSINGDTMLRNLTLTGFKSVIIRGCPNLKKLIINDTVDNTCEKIIIEIPEYTPGATETRDYLMSFNSTTDGVFDFTKYSGLKVLGLSGSEAEVIKIPNQKVSIETFRENHNLEFVDTSGQYSIIELTRDFTFYKSPRYGMRQSWWSINGTSNGVDITTLNSSSSAQEGNYTRICVSPECTTLSHTFDKVDSVNTKYPTSSSTPYKNSWGQYVYNKIMIAKDAGYFVNTCVAGLSLDDEYVDENNIIHDNSESSSGFTLRPEDWYPGESDGRRKDCRPNITSLQGCFYKQNGINYSGGNTTLPNLSTFIKLTDISNMYYGTQVRYLSSRLLSLPPELNNNDDLDDETIPTHTLNWDNFIANGDMKIEKDAFKYISYRLTNLTYMNLTIYKLGTSDSNINANILPTDENNYLNIVDILYPQTDGEDNIIPFRRLKSFTAFSVNPAQYVDYTQLFIVCPEVTQLSGFLNSDLSHSKIDNILGTCTHLQSVDNSFNHTGDMAEAPTIDLYSFFNWEDENLFGMSNLFTSSSNDVGFSVNKYISQENFTKILNVLHNYKNIKRLSNIFSYCTINGYDGSEIKLGNLEENEQMTGITNINSLFFNCKGIDVNEQNKPLRIRRSFFEALPNITVMVNTFRNVYFDHMLSYDFFCKREYKPETNNIYVKIDGTYKPATLQTIKYNTYLIDDMSNCFMGAKFVDCKNWFDINDGNMDLKPPKDVVTYNGDSSYTEYYKQEYGIYVKYDIKESEAYTDTLNNFTNYVATVQNDKFRIDNHNINGDLTTFGNAAVGYPYIENTFNIYPTYCCLPPDIFYCCKYNCDLTNVFADTNIIGVIPQHLVMNCYDSKFNNMFQNVNILPNVIYHYNSQTANDANYINLINEIDSETHQYKIPIDNDTITIENEDDHNTYTLVGSTDADAVVLFRNSDGELRRRYPMSSGEYSKSQFVYIPQGYTTNSNLPQAFTFRYNLPAQVDLYSSSLLNNYGIDWSEGVYGNDYTPDLRPDLWPYYTQYFFTVDESIDWGRIYNMNSPFISDDQDVSFSANNDGVFENRLFSSDVNGYDNKWWNERQRVTNTIWHTATHATITNSSLEGGLFNVFLNLCGKRNIRTGQLTDYGIPLNKALKNSPVLTSFVSGILVIFLNGKIFDDNTDGGNVLTNNGYSIINYYHGFGNNIQLPYIHHTIDRHPTVLLAYPPGDNTSVTFYLYMFPTNSWNNYLTIFGGDDGIKRRVIDFRNNQTYYRYLVRQ